MKRRFLLVLLIVSVLVACHSPRREAKRVLSCAERLLDTLPDSTACLIDSVLRMPVQFSEGMRMDMALLQAEALFGNAALDDDLTDAMARNTTSFDLERAVAYYAKKRAYAKAAHAALYCGYVQQHYNDKTAAMQSFKDAEHYGGIVHDSLTVAIAQYNIGRMLCYDYMETEAIHILELAYRNFGNQYTNKSFVQSAMAVSYMLDQQFEMAEICLNQSLNYSKLGHSNEAKIKSLNNFAVLFRFQGKNEKAIEYLNQISKEPYLDETQSFSLYLNLGKTYAAKFYWDSAAYYYQRLDSLLLTVQVKDETKVSAYKAFSLFYESQGDDISALKYRKQYELYLDEVKEQTEQRTIYGIQRKYDNEALQNEMNKIIIQRQRIISLLCLIAAFVLMAFAVSQIHLAKIKKQEADIKADLCQFMQQNEELIKQSEDYSEKYAKAMMKEQHILQKMALYDSNKSDNALFHALKYSIFGKQDYWNAMLSVFDKQFPNMRKQILSQHPDLSDKELKVLLLSYIDTSREDTAILLNISIFMVDKIRNSVRKKLSKTT